MVLGPHESVCKCLPQRHTGKPRGGTTRTHRPDATANKILNNSLPTRGRSPSCNHREDDEPVAPVGRLRALLDTLTCATLEVKTALGTHYFKTQTPTTENVSALPPAWAAWSIPPLPCGQEPCRPSFATHHVPGVRGVCQVKSHTLQLPRGDKTPTSPGSRRMSRGSLGLRARSLAPALVLSEAAMLLH